MRRRARAALVVATLFAGASTRDALAQSRQIEVRWLGHAAFEVISSTGTRLLIDPFIGGNPATPDSLRGLPRYEGANKPSAILVSHSHSDHASDAKAIAQATGAPIIGDHDWVTSLGLTGSQGMGGNVGGSMTIGDVTVHLVPAMHGSAPGGRPLGFVIEFADGRAVYHTGDTWIFRDMELIQERYRPEIILLNVGGGPFTQNPATAALAIKKYFKPKTIVPMHYGTFPALATEADVRSAFGKDKRLTIMRPGESRKF